MLPVTLDDAGFPTSTSELEPLKERALPNLPCVVHAAPLIVPLLPFPDASPAVDPLPSSNAYAATASNVALWATADEMRLGRTSPSPTAPRNSKLFRRDGFGVRPVPSGEATTNAALGLPHRAMIHRPRSAASQTADRKRHGGQMPERRVRRVGRRAATALKLEVCTVAAMDFVYPVVNGRKRVR